MMDRAITLVDKLTGFHMLSGEEFTFLLDNIREEEDVYLYRKARESVLANYENKIYVRGLMGFTNYCKNDRHYCGIHRSNQKAFRYRLSPGQITECCRIGYGLGFRTFALQGGEDPWLTDEKIAYLVECIKKQYPDCAVTLSASEKGYDTYKRWFDAEASRYLLHHKTANPCRYASPHPPQMPSEYRKECLHNLKAIGYQTSCGIIADSPYRTTVHVAQDPEFIHDLQPEMVGVGPFIPHHDTPFRDRPARTLRQTLLLLAIVRLMLPDVLLSATTAPGTTEPDRKEQGVVVGTNMVVPDLSPLEMRKKYMLYDNKINTGVEAAASIKESKGRMASIGYEVVTDRGDHKKIKSSPCPQSLIITLKVTLSINSSVLQILHLQIIKKVNDRK